MAQEWPLIGHIAPFILRTASRQEPPPSWPLDRNISHALFLRFRLKSNAKLFFRMLTFCILSSIECPREFVARAHAAGKRVVYWTLNSPAEMATCIAAGADGFFTDDVPLARATLAAANLLSESETARNNSQQSL